MKIKPIKIVDLGIAIYDSDGENYLQILKDEDIDTIVIEDDKFNFYNTYLTGVGYCTVFYKTTRSAYYTKYFGLVKYIYNKPIEEFNVYIDITDATINIKEATQKVKDNYFYYKSCKEELIKRTEEIKNKQFIL